MTPWSKEVSEVGANASAFNAGLAITRKVQKAARKGSQKHRIQGTCRLGAENMSALRFLTSVSG